MEHSDKTEKRSKEIWDRGGQKDIIASIGLLMLKKREVQGFDLDHLEKAAYIFADEWLKFMESSDG